GIAAGELMPLDDTFEALAFRGADGIDEIARREQRGPDDIAGFHFLREVPKFLDAFDRDAAELLDMTEQRFGEALFLLVVEAQLDGVVAVLAILRLDLEHAVRSRQHNGDRV